MNWWRNNSVVQECLSKCISWADQINLPAEDVFLLPVYTTSHLLKKKKQKSIQKEIRTFFFQSQVRTISSYWIFFYFESFNEYSYYYERYKLTDILYFCIFNINYILIVNIYHKYITYFDLFFKTTTQLSFLTFS